MSCTSVESPRTPAKATADTNMVFHLDSHLRVYRCKRRHHRLWSCQHDRRCKPCRYYIALMLAQPHIEYLFARAQIRHRLRQPLQPLPPPFPVTVCLVLPALMQQCNKPMFACRLNNKHRGRREQPRFALSRALDLDMLKPHFVFARRYLGNRHDFYGFGHHKQLR